MNRYFFYAVLTIFVHLAADGQNQTPETPTATGVRSQSPATSSASSGAELSYKLGGGDQVSIDIPDLSDEFTAEKVFRIDGDGDLGLPIIGHIQAAGMTGKELEAAIRAKLVGILRKPDVTVNIVGFASQPVAVLGAVNSPGMFQVGGGKNLFELLSIAGGLADNAGFEVTITRDIRNGPIPLNNAHLDSTGQYSIASVPVKDLLRSSHTDEDIKIFHGDKVAVPPSDLVYAVGNVNKPGGFLLNEHETLSALQVLSLAQGLNRTAAADRAKILRVVPGSPKRQEITINLSQLMSGKAEDFQLQAQDILFVPNSKAKSTSFRALDALTAASSAVIFTASR
jgi:polysaccharide export outer membrane protein